MPREQGAVKGGVIKIALYDTGQYKQDSVCQEGLLDTEVATHSGNRAGKMSWTGEPGGLQSTGSQRAGHD